MSRTAAFLICIPLCSAALGLACSSRNQDIALESPTTDESLAAGEFRVDVDPRAGTVVFTPIDSLVGSKNFQQVAKGNIKFETPAAVWGAGTVGSTTTPYADDGTCAANQFCAQIKATNLTGLAAKNLWVEISALNGDATVVGNGDRDKGYAEGAYAQSASYDGGTQTKSDYLSFAYGAYRYGELVNGSSALRNWRFDVPTGATFTFNVRVLATFPRNTYKYSDGGLSVDATPPFVAYNACDTSTGVDAPTTYFEGSGINLGTKPALSQKITFPFPVTIFGVTSTTGYILSNGLVTLVTPDPSLVIGSNQNPPWGAANEPKSAFVPFWDSYLYAQTTSKVCVANVTGASPRAVVVTWKDVRGNGYTYAGSSTTFSLVIREFSDFAEYIYFQPTLQAKGDWNAARGISATIGIASESSTNPISSVLSSNAVYLTGPLSSEAEVGQVVDGRFPQRILVSTTADPAPCSAGGCNSDGGGG